MISSSLRGGVSLRQELTRTLEPAAALRWLAALLSLGAASFHFAVAPEHFAEFAAFGWFFVVVAWLQAAWALAAIATPRRWLFDFGIVLNAGLVGIWLWTRLVAVPLGPGTGAPEQFGAVDIVTSVMELGTMLACLGALEFGRLNRRIPILAIVAATIAVVAISGIVLGREQGRTSEALSTNTAAGAHVGH